MFVCLLFSLLPSRIKGEMQNYFEKKAFIRTYVFIETKKRGKKLQKNGKKNETGKI